MRNAMNQLETYERESSRNGIETIEEAVPFGLDQRESERVWLIEWTDDSDPESFEQDEYAAYTSCQAAINDVTRVDLPIIGIWERTLPGAMQNARDELVSWLVLLDESGTERARWSV